MKAIREIENRVGSIQLITQSAIKYAGKKKRNPPSAKKLSAEEFASKTAGSTSYQCVTPLKGAITWNGSSPSTLPCRNASPG